MQKVAADYCDCLYDAFRDLSPEIKELLIKTAYTKDPAVSLSDELKKIDNEDEYNRQLSTLRKMGSNGEALDCTAEMRRRLSVDEDDIIALSQVAKANENINGCEFPAAMLRHSINTKERKRKRKVEQQNYE